MIKINNIEYRNYNIKITWGDFEVCTDNIKRIGVAPFIALNIDDNIFIGLEFTFAKEMFEEIKLNDKINIDKYISDIQYEDDEGWVSVITGKYNCNIMRLNESEFKLELNVQEEINIDIDTIIELL